MDRGTAMLAVVLDVYEGGKDLIPGWKLKEHAESALATGGVEGLRRYYEADERLWNRSASASWRCTWVLPNDE